MITLRDYQTEAVEFLLPRRRAFVKAPAGSGKTIIGASAIARAVRPGWRVLWVANTREQVEQAIKAIESTPGPDGVEFEICCAASAPDGRKFDLIVLDECFPAGTKVDGRPIETFVPGDWIQAYDHGKAEVQLRKVRQVFSRPYHGPWVRIKLANGQEVVCTEGHPIYVEGFGYVAAKSLTMMLRSADTPLHVLTLPQDVHLSELQKADCLPESPVSSQPASNLCGGASGRPGLLQPGMSGRDPSRPQLSDDASNQHVEIRRPVEANVRPESDGQRGDSRKSVSGPAGEALSGDPGRQRETVESPSQKAAEPLPGSRGGVCHLDRTGEDVGGRTSNLGNDGYHPVGVQSGRGFSDREGSGGSGWTLAPNEPRQGEGRQEGPRAVLARVESVEVFEPESPVRPDWVPSDNRVYNLHVDRVENYFANGILVHNCHHTPAATWFAILQQAPGIVWGLSATPWSEDRERNDVMRDVFKEFFEVERARVEASGSLAKGTVIFHDLDEPGCYDAEINLLTAEEVERRVRRFRFISRDEHERRAKWQITQTFVQGNPTRNAKIREIANSESAAGASVLLLIQSIEHGERLAEGIPGSALVFSRVGAKKRRELISAFRAGDLKVLAATSLADEGLDVPIASRLIMAAGGRAAGKIEQRAGRVLRPHPSKKDGGIIHDFLDRGAQYAMAQAKARRRVYEKLGYC